MPAFAPDGKSLTDREIFRMQSSAEVLATLRDAVARFGPVTPRAVQPSWQPPDKGVGVRPDGSVRLASKPVKMGPYLPMERKY